MTLNNNPGCDQRLTIDWKRNTGSNFAAYVKNMSEKHLNNKGSV